MKLRLRIEFFVLVVLIPGLVISFTACQGKQGSSSTVSAEKIKIIYAGYPDPSGAKKKVVDDFNASHKNIEVVAMDMPANSNTMHDAYVTAFAAGSSDYDVISSNLPWPAEFEKAGYVTALDKFVKKDNLNIQDFFPNYIQAYTINGQLWGLPNYANVGILYYRKDLVSTPPTTWDDLLRQSKALMASGKVKYGFLPQAAQNEVLVCNAVEYIGSYGGQIVDSNGSLVIDSDAVRNGLSEFKRIVDSGICPSDVTTYLEANSTTMFLAGDGAFCRNWPNMWSVSQSPDKSKVVGKVGIAPLPASATGKSSGCLGGYGCMINKHSKNIDGAWEFVKYLTSEQGQKTQSTIGGWLPTRPALYKDADVLKANPQFSWIYAAMGTAITRPVSPVYSKLSEIMQIDISKLLWGAMPVKTAVEDMNGQMKAIMSASK